MHAQPATAHPGGVIPHLDLPMRLFIARRHAGLEQEELATLLEKSKKTIGRYERGEVRTPKSMVMAWALATGVQFEWLAGQDYQRGGPTVTLGYTDTYRRRVVRRSRRGLRAEFGETNKVERPMCGAA